VSVPLAVACPASSSLTKPVSSPAIAAASLTPTMSTVTVSVAVPSALVTVKLSLACWPAARCWTAALLTL